MQYRYRPLSSKGREIRLLEVLPHSAISKSPLSCRIIHVSLDGTPSPQYEAISYVWGNPDPCEQLLVNRKKLHVPRNTFSVLQRMALANRSRLLWIDAVCINQSDIEERSRQVALMRDIYQCATQGLIYLGEGSEWACSAFEIIKAMLPEIEQDIGPAGNILDALWEGHRWKRAESGIQTTFEERPLHELFAAPWFRRAWVVQEASLTPRNVCVWGTSTIDLDSVLMTAAWLEKTHADHISPGLYSSKGLGNAAQLYLARMDCQEKKGRSLFSIFAHVQDLEASDARDKVYAAIGLLRKEDQGLETGLLTPNYAKSLAQVLQDATRQGIMTPGAFGPRAFSLEILRGISHLSNSNLESNCPGGFPSWTLRLDRAWSHDVHPSELPSHPDRGVAVKAARKQVDMDLLGSRGLPHLVTLRGVELDTILAVTSTAPFLGPDANDVLAWISEVESLLAECSASAPQHHGLVQLLICDVNWWGLQCSPADSHGYSLLLERFRLGRGVAPNQAQDATEDVVHAANTYHAINARCRHRKVAISKAGYLLVVPKVTEPGDVITDLNGNLYPFILRQRNGEYRMIGECYLDGAMPWQIEEYAKFQEAMRDRQETVFDII